LKTLSPTSALPLRSIRAWWPSWFHTQLKISALTTQTMQLTTYLPYAAVMILAGLAADKGMRCIVAMAVTAVVSSNAGTYDLPN